MRLLKEHLIKSNCKEGKEIIPSYSSLLLSPCSPFLPPPFPLFYCPPFSFPLVLLSSLLLSPCSPFLPPPFPLFSFPWGWGLLKLQQVWQTSSLKLFEFTSIPVQPKLTRFLCLCVLLYLILLQSLLIPFENIDLFFCLFSRLAHLPF